MPQKSVRIAPSILSADFSALGAEVEAIDAAGADWIHVDVMDNHFVPNLTIGPVVVKALRPHTRLPFDVHLMVTPVAPLVRALGVEEVRGDLDLVVVMSVNPGFGGQAFIESQLAKIAALRKAIDALGK